MFGNQIIYHEVADRYVGQWLNDYLGKDIGFPDRFTEPQQKMLLSVFLDVFCVVEGHGSELLNSQKLECFDNWLKDNYLREELERVNK